MRAMIALHLSRKRHYVGRRETTGTIATRMSVLAPSMVASGTSTMHGTTVERCMITRAPGAFSENKRKRILVLRNTRTRNLTLEARRGGVIFFGGSGGGFETQHDRLCDVYFRRRQHFRCSSLFAIMFYTLCWCASSILVSFMMGPSVVQRRRAYVGRDTGWIE